MQPIHIPNEWDDNALILFEEFCELIRTPQRTVRDWRRRGIGPAGPGSKASAGSTSPSPKPAASSPLPSPQGTPTIRSTPMADRRPATRWLSLQEAADSMSVTVKTIRRWIADGTIPAYRCGKRAIRVKQEDLDAAPRQIPSARW